MSADGGQGDREEIPVPSPSSGSPRILAYTAAQRRALIATVGIFITCIAALLIRNPQHVPDPMPSEPTHYGDLADRIDPNTCDVQTLSALPDLGPKRAKDIIDYRERVRAGDPSRIVFATLDDLMRVKGVGNSTIQKLDRYLRFGGKTTN